MLNCLDNEGQIEIKDLLMNVTKNSFKQLESITNETGNSSRGWTQDFSLERAPIPPEATLILYF